MMSIIMCQAFSIRPMFAAAGAMDYDDHHDVHPTRFSSRISKSGNQRERRQNIVFNPIRRLTSSHLSPITSHFSLTVPWPKEHKDNTRKRIVEAAAAAFRQHGIDRVGVADIMRAAGLTHGGFYSHFASKDDLLAATVAYATAQVTEMIESRAPMEASLQPLLDAALVYLSAAHFAHPEWGCPVPALGPDLIRSSSRVRKTFAADLKKRLEQLLDRTPEKLPAAARRQQAAGVYACMVGALIIARGLKESDGLEFLKDCQVFLRQALSDTDRRELPG